MPIHICVTCILLFVNVLLIFYFFFLTTKYVHIIIIIDHCLFSWCVSQRIDRQENTKSFPNNMLFSIVRGII